MNLVKSTTLQTIADELHLSRSTVSRVLSGNYKKHGISKSTSEAVIAKANDLKYIKNESARSLRTQKTNTIGVIVRDITNLFYSQFVKNIEYHLYVKGYTVIICNTDYDLAKERGHIENLLSRKVDGIIWSPIEKSNDNIMFVKERNIPLILFDCKIDMIESDFVVVDNEISVTNAVDYLIALGHRKIAYIGGNLFDSNNLLRYAGYEKALRKASIAIRDDYIKHGSYVFDHGYNAALELLHLEDMPTAFFVANNRIVMGAYKGIYDFGYQIPDDVSIIGFDDFEAAPLLRCPLTVISQPLQAMASYTINLLLARIERKNGMDYVTKIFNTELILRRSTNHLK